MNFSLLSLELFGLTGFSWIEIAEKVWNTHFDTGTNFIDVYINYLRKKIDKDFETKLIHTKPGIGFILTDEKP